MVQSMTRAVGRRDLEVYIIGKEGRGDVRSCRKIKMRWIR